MTQDTRPKPPPAARQPGKANPAQNPANDVRTFDAEIELYDGELRAIIEKMDKTSQRFIAATIQCLVKYYPLKARTCVQEQYELSNRLGLDRIRQLKQQVARLVQGLPADAQKLLCDGNLWWHKSRGGGWQDHTTPGPPDGLSMAIWALEERVSPILESFGYVDKERRAARDSETGELRARNKRRGDGQIEWTDEMNKSIDSYKEDLGRAIFLDSKVQQARKRKAIHIAGTLWDKA